MRVLRHTRDHGGWSYVQVAACVADVAALENTLTPQLLAGFQAALARAPLVVLDGNLSAAALQVQISSAQ